MTDNLEDRLNDVDRRQFLKGVGIVGGAGGVIGYGAYRATLSSGTPSSREPSETSTPVEQPSEPSEPSIEERFETVVDAVDAGAEPDGSEPINFLFDEYTDDSTAFVFEPGTYEMEPIQITDRRTIGIVDSGDEPPGFVPVDGDCRGGHPFVLLDGVEDLLLRNLRFDFRDTDSGGPFHLFLEGDSTIRNVSYLGTCSNQLGIARIEVIDPDGSALVDGLETPSGNQDDSLTGMYVGADHSGELTFRDCDFDEFSDNGLYASAPGGSDGGDGPVHVVGGNFRNNNIANVRLGSSGSTAEDVTIVVDSETPGWGQLNARGIRLRNKAGQVIDDCDITFGSDAAASFGAIVFHPANGGGTVRSTDIRLDQGDIPAVRAFPPEEDTDPGTVTLEGVSITGTADEGVTSRIEGRDETVFRDCRIEQPDRPGLLFRDCDDCRIVDSTVSVDRAPVRAEGSTLLLENTTVSTDDDEVFFEEHRLHDESLEL